MQSTEIKLKYIFTCLAVGFLLTYFSEGRDLLPFSFLSKVFADFLKEQISPLTMKVTFYGAFIYLLVGIIFSSLRQRSEKIKISPALNGMIITFASTTSLLTGSIYAYSALIFQVSTIENAAHAFFWSSCMLLLTFSFLWFFDMMLKEKHEVTNNMNGYDFRSTFKIFVLIFLIAVLVGLAVEIRSLAQ